jgi:hypothetical protein
VSGDGSTGRQGGLPRGGSDAPGRERARSGARTASAFGSLRNRVARHPARSAPSRGVARLGNIPKRACASEGVGAKIVESADDTLEELDLPSGWDVKPRSTIGSIGQVASLVGRPDSGRASWLARRRSECDFRAIGPQSRAFFAQAARPRTERARRSGRRRSVYGKLTDRATVKREIHGQSACRGRIAGEGEDHQ